MEDMRRLSSSDKESLLRTLLMKVFINVLQYFYNLQECYAISLKFFINNFKRRRYKEEDKACAGTSIENLRTYSLKTASDERPPNTDLRRNI